MGSPIGIRIDEKTREKLENDAKKSGMALSTYANKILTDWTNVYKPMLESDSMIFPVPLIKMFYNFIKEDDHEIVANFIAEYWHANMKSSIVDPTYDNYVSSLTAWANSTNQRFTVFNDVPIKHVFHHDWGYSYSKITVHLFRKTFESLGFKFVQIDVKENMFSYFLHPNTIH